MSEPLIYQITNTVSAQLQADVTALLGGASIMSRQIAEAAQIAASCDAMLLNIGTPPDNALELYRTALRAAAENSKPVVLDIVGYGFSKYRTEIADKLLDEFTFSIIKGNESEIGALGGAGTIPVGVSSGTPLSDAGKIVKACAKKYNCVVCSTGEKDHISDGERTAEIEGGSPLMRRTSGIGCALGSAAALFCTEDKPFDAAFRALTLFRTAASKAEPESRGAYSFRIRFMDLLAELKGDKTK